MDHTQHRFRTPGGMKQHFLGSSSPHGPLGSPTFTHSPPVAFIPFTCNDTFTLQ